MERLYCRGNQVRKTISHAATRQGYHLIVEVPTWVCEQCGEPLFDEETVNEIQAMLREVDRRVKKLTPALA